MTSSEIRNQQFKKTMWGYAPADVAEFLDRLAKEWDKIQGKEKELSDRIRNVNDELLRWKAKEAEIEKMKERAQSESERYFREVEERAEGVRQRTEEWLEQVLAEVEQTQRRKQSFMTAFRNALDSHYELLRQGESAAEGEDMSASLNQFLRAKVGAELSEKN